MTGNETKPMTKMLHGDKYKSKKGVNCKLVDGMCLEEWRTREGDLEQSGANTANQPLGH